MKNKILLALPLTLFVGACTHPNLGTPGTTTPHAEATSNGPLWQNVSGGFVPTFGSVASSVQCRDVELNLRLDRTAPEPAPPKLIGEPSECPRGSTFSGYLRSTLFLEGLDANGGRLFVATGSNPLHQDLEVPPPASGGQFSWNAVNNKMPVVTTLIQAPLTPALVKLRWYDVDEKMQPHELGETIWPGR